MGGDRSIENALTCYRAPKWPDPEFPRKIPKKYPPARNSGLPEFTPKIPKKYPQNTKNEHFWYVWGIFGVFSWGSRISGWGVFFRYFSWKFQVGPSRGSVAGRGVLNRSKMTTGIFGLPVPVGHCCSIFRCLWQTHSNLNIGQCQTPP